MFKKALLASLGATTLLATPASAATLVFQGGTGGTAAGWVDYANFDSTIPAYVLVGTGGIVNGSVGGQYAEPAFGDQGDDYFYVSGGAGVTFDFGIGASRLAFDLGSADDYNTLRVFFEGGGSQVFFGAQLNPPGPASGNQVVPATNGRVTVIAGAGEVITGAEFVSGQPSFEFDNIGLAAVPEPTTWALFILGFGAIGGALRRRNAKVRTTRAALNFA